VQKTESLTTWSAWGETNPGKKREDNEDRILCDAERGIFMVVDGMGGEAAGEVAAQKAVDFIKKRLNEETGTAARRLREAIAGANNEIYRLAERNPQWRGMACVLTAAVIDNGILHVGHVGDSRLYKIHKSAIAKVTPDHSPIGNQEDSGELTELEAMRHPRRNEVFRDVGSQLHKPDDADFIEYLQLPFERDAAYVLCSDGLSDMLTAKEISGVVLGNAGKPKHSVHQLIEKANAAGGKDNISAIVIEAQDFAGSAGGVRSQNGNDSSPRVFLKNPARFFCRRWAFLIYGLVAGLLLSYLLLRPAETEVTLPEISSVRPPAVLRVSPGSTEYPTIASALEAAHPGDRIEVGDGEYEESIRLREGIELAAQTPGKAVLLISRALPDTEAAIASDGIKRAVVSGIVIKAEPAAGLPFGIKISNSSVYISNMEVSGARNAGMLIDGNSGGIITGSYIYANAGSGILTSGSARPLMTGNLVYANGKSGNPKLPGLYITGNSNPEVKRNVFSGNGAEAIRLQRQELKDRMMDNLFINSGRPGKAVAVERIGR
jgi:PPM family protein phosphatase